LFVVRASPTADIRSRTPPVSRDRSRHSRFPPRLKIVLEGGSPSPLGLQHRPLNSSINTRKRRYEAREKKSDIKIRSRPSSHGERSKAFLSILAWLESWIKNMCVFFPRQLRFGRKNPRPNSPGRRPRTGTIHHRRRHGSGTTDREAELTIPT